MPAKYDRMRRHIQASGSARGLSGRQLDRYVFGAMRDRGWKPKRELEENIIRGTGKFLRADAQKTKARFKQRVNKLGSPLFRYRRALAYKEQGHRELAAGNYDRGLTMINRGNRVAQRHAPEAFGIAVGAGLGATIPLPLATETGAIAGRYGAKTVARPVGRALARRRRLQKRGG